MLYLPSLEDRERWRDLAEKANKPFSTWVCEIVEFYLANLMNNDKINLPAEMEELREELRKAKAELREKDALIEKNEAELYKYRHNAFSKIDSDKAKKYDSDLVELLAEGKTVDGREILHALGILPEDQEAMKLVRNQLEELLRFGLVKETANGWRWIGGSR